MNARILLAAACLAAAAAWAGEPHETEAVPATVTVYRLGGANLAALAAVIERDGAAPLRLGRHQYAEISLPPGRHVLSVRALGYARHGTLEIEVDESARLYYELRPNKRRPGLFAAPVPVAGEAAIVAEAAATQPFLTEARSAESFRQALPALKRKAPQD